MPKAALTSTTSNAQDAAYAHPHPDPRHIMNIYRTYLLSCKQKFGSARGLGHYHGLLQTYLAAKRKVLHACQKP